MKNGEDNREQDMIDGWRGTNERRGGIRRQRCKIGFSLFLPSSQFFSVLLTPPPIPPLWAECSAEK